MEHRLNVPFQPDDLRALRAGDVVYLSGVIFTARDAAHARFDQMLKARETLPVPKGACIYYCGPCPAAQFIGKGARNSTVNAAMKGRAVHFAATGGAGMLYASRITSCELVAFPDLGAEAVYRLEVTDFPVVVTFDLLGNDVYARDIAK
jgi:fumarate hydratase subunit beta